MLWGCSYRDPYTLCPTTHYRDDPKLLAAQPFLRVAPQHSLYGALRRRTTAVRAYRGFPVPWIAATFENQGGPCMFAAWAVFAGTVQGMALAEVQLVGRTADQVDAHDSAVEDAQFAVEPITNGPVRPLVDATATVVRR
jgi:hypothetical protein